jgi:hypothetical protein
MADETTLYQVIATDVELGLSNKPVYVRGQENLRNIVKMYSGESLKTDVQELSELPAGVTEDDLAL